MTDQTIYIEVRGEPKGQPRPRAFSMGGRVRVYNPATAEGWKSAIASAALPHVPPMPLQGPLRVDVAFVFKRPNAHFGTGKNAAVLKATAPQFHVAKPDRDNLDKAVLDALTTIGMWHDDAQVAMGTLSKRYARPGELAGATILIEPLLEAAEDAQDAPQ